MGSGSGPRESGALLRSPGESVLASGTDRAESMVTRFRRSFFFAAMLPSLFFCLVCLVAAGLARDHLAELVAGANDELTRDAERSLQNLGESIIRQRARDVAAELAVYLRAQPPRTLADLRADPEFVALALQEVGETGYTGLTEAGTDSTRILLHPNPDLVDQDMHEIGRQLPDWHAIVEEGLSGREVEGYYDWRDPDGATRAKFLVATPVAERVGDTILMVSATAYIDEFSAPVVAMRERASAIQDTYQETVSREAITFAVAFALLLLSALLATYLIGTWSARRFIDPIGRLADVVREFGAGEWRTDGLEEIAARHDEIGTLAKTFQRLTAQIVDLFDRLDQRVADLNDAQAALQQSEDELRRLYEESKQTEAIYRSLLHSSADGIVVLDMDLCVTYLSPAFTRLFGWSEQELQGEMIPYLPEDEQESTLGILDRVLREGVPFQGYPTRRYTKDGRLVDVSVSASRFDDHEGNPKGVLAIVRDVSESKRVEAEMQRLGRLEAIATLAGGVAHDFNNLLTVIQANVSMLKTEVDVDADGHASLCDIEDQVQSGASLTRQLLGFARKGRYEVEVAHLNETVEKVAQAVGRTRKHVVLHLDLAPDLRPVEADLHQVEQVLLNLYINACDAMPDGGDLSISTANVEDDGRTMVELRVADTGAGMDPEIMDRIFDPFFTTKELGRGTGLGLASSYGIVESHGGRIDVDSQPGVGTTFRVLLPATGRDAVPAAERANPVSHGHGRVLIIDDEKLVLRATARLVRSLGYDVLTAESGEEGIELYREQAGGVDLVVLDMVMPGLGGRQVFERLRALDPDVRVVVCSGYSVEDAAMEELVARCHGRIQKPYTLEVLATSLETALRDGAGADSARDPVR